MARVLRICTIAAFGCLLFMACQTPSGVEQGDESPADRIASAPSAQTFNMRVNPPLVGVTVYAINLRAGFYPDENPQGLSERLRCHAEKMRAAIDGGMDWDIIATVEGAETIDCYVNGEETQPAACLAEAIRGTRRADVHAVGESALIINADRFDVLDRFKAVLNNLPGNAARRPFAAARLRLRESGKTFIAGAAHLNTAATNYCYRQAQVDDMVLALERWSQPSDSAAIVAGDFNCVGDTSTEPGWTCEYWWPGDFLDSEFMSDEENDRNLCKHLAESVRSTAGFGVKDKILVMNGAAPIGSMVTWGVIREFEECSDHAAVYASFVTGCSCPQGQVCAGSFVSPHCAACAACDGVTCGRNECGVDCGCAPGQECIQDRCSRIRPPDAECIDESDCTCGCRPNACSAVCLHGRCRCIRD